MISSNSLRRREGPFGSASRGPLSAFVSPLAAFGARSPFLASWALSVFGALSVLGALSAFSPSGFLSSLSAIDLNSRPLGEADLLVAHDLEADAGRFAVLRIGEREVGQVYRGFLGDDAAFLARGLLLVTLDHVDAAHQRAVLRAAHLDHFAAAPLVAAGNDHDGVALADLRRHHSTSGASDMIFMWFLARSSRGTGPKMRVPTGSICGLISTAALLSKRMTEPSGRLISLRIRTTTAFITSPFLTRPRGAASFTDTTMTSPMVAYFRLDPPSTLMHMTRRAPELSATSRLVCIWIIDAPLPSFYAPARFTLWLVSRPG